MQPEQLRMFLAAAESGSFSAAAARLYVNHSTVSRAVSALEAELGTALFYREARGLRPTEAGRLLAEEGPALLRSVQELCDRIREKGEKICDEKAGQ